MLACFSVHAARSGIGMAVSTSLPLCGSLYSARIPGKKIQTTTIENLFVMSRPRTLCRHKNSSKYP